MINLIYSEFLKLKRNNIILIIILSGVLLPIFLQMLLVISYLGIQEDMYMNTLELIMFLILTIILYTLLISHIFIREFSDKMAKVLYSYPHSRIKIFWSKVIVFCIIGFGIYLLQLLLALFFVYYYTNEIEYVFLIKHIKIYIFTFLLQITIQPFMIFLSFLSKNIIVPVVAAIMITGINVIIFFINSITIEIIWFPTYLPILPMQYFLGEKVDIFYNIIASVLLLVSGLYLCINYIRKISI